MTFLVRLTLICVVALSAAACRPKPLPEADTPAAKTYIAACATCHVAYPPSLFTAAMWSTVVDRMDREMRRQRRPMTVATKAEILDYLQRHAGER